MTIKNILVPFLGKQSARLAFEAATLLAKQDKAHISCLHVRQRPPPTPTAVYYPLGGVDAGFAEAAQQAENKLADELQQLFRTLCDENKVGVCALAEHTNGKGATASWREQEGDIFSLLAGHAMACDLSIIAAIGENAEPLATSTTEELLFQSGRPVLLCPPAGLKSAPKRIILAWNGRPEAARAVNAGLGLMKKAEAVRVVTVRKAEAPPVNTDEITAYLRLHDVEARQTEIELAEKENETDLLKEKIAEFKADLVIMGAYSHSRWREAVLGGFTRHMLRHAAIPVFMMQ